jgi:hypothetical protein
MNFHCWPYPSVSNPAIPKAGSEPASRYSSRVAGSCPALRASGLPGEAHVAEKRGLSLVVVKLHQPPRPLPPQSSPAIVESSSSPRYLGCSCSHNPHHTPGHRGLGGGPRCALDTRSPPRWETRERDGRIGRRAHTGRSHAGGRDSRRRRNARRPGYT